LVRQKLAVAAVAALTEASGKSSKLKWPGI
jgi:hypothetical protein